MMTKRRLVCVSGLALCCVTTLAIATDVQLLSSDSTFKAPVIAENGGGPLFVPRGGGVCLEDGNFEGGTGCGVWSESSNTTCTWVLDPLPVWGIPAPQCTQAWWGGGYCGSANSNSVCQILDVPADATDLEFTYIKWRVDGDDFNGDVITVSINSTVLHSLSLDGPTTSPEPAVTTSVSVAAYAGTTVRLVIEATSVGSLTGNALYDGFQWLGPAGTGCDCTVASCPGGSGSCGGAEGEGEGEGEGVCGDGGDCCVVGDGPHCSDIDCCDAVCAVDPYCCDTNWDIVCVNAALDEPLCNEGQCGGVVTCDGVWLCDGDANGDGVVDPIDSGGILARFGLDPCVEGCQWDLNCDGVLDPLDSGYALGRFGTCDPPPVCEVNCD